MDLLFQRYASPYSILDMVIQERRLKEFLIEFAKYKREDDLERVWLLKVHDKTFKQFKEENTIKKEQPSKEKLKAAVNNSIEILKNFNPS
jgi:hypothetical protein